MGDGIYLQFLPFLHCRTQAASATKTISTTVDQTLNYDEKLTIGVASTFAPSPAPPVELKEKGGMGLEDD